MQQRCAAMCVAWMLVGCGSAAGSLEGKVQGHEISVKEAIYILLPDGEVFLAAADQENLCAVMNGDQKPTSEMNLLEAFLANWNGSSLDPLVTGTYTATHHADGPGKWSFPIFFWTKECLGFTRLTPNSGAITLESVGLQQPGGQTTASVDLVFGDTHLTGHLTASYCARAAQFGTACQPQQIRAPPPSTE